MALAILARGLADLGARVQVVGLPLEEVVGKEKPVPLDHPWILGARHVGTVFGD